MMRMAMIGQVLAFSLVLAASPARGALVFYTSRSAFNAATTGVTTDSFAGIAPNNSFNYYSSGSYTSSSGTNYAINKATSNGNLFINGPNYYSSPAPSPYISSQLSSSTNNNLTVTFARPVTAIGLDYSSYNAATLTFTLSTGDQFTETTVGGAYPGTFAFIGFTSTSAITSIQVVDPNVTSSEGFNLANVSFQFQAVPEPTSLALMGMGLMGVGLVARRRRAGV